MKKLIGFLTVLLFAYAGKLQAQKTTSFNFSRAAQAVGGWVNVYGDPSVATVEVTDAITGFHISSIAPANWAPFGIGCSYDGGGAPGGTFFPAAVMLNQWSQFSDYYALYNAAIPQFKITGLKVDSVYTLKMTGSFNDSNSLNNPNPTRFSVAGTTVYGYVDVNASHNTANGAVFHNIAPDATGAIRVYVNTFGGSTLASINGLKIIEERSMAPTPVVSFTYPSNKDALPELGNINLAASATETGGTITKVEFYVDGVLIGYDSVAPYNFSWIDPPSGRYTIKARAIDGLGNAGSATINVSIESLGSFWSTTGNIATGGDTSFVGTVDTNRLAFRTNNIERMSISKNGNVTIGGKDTASHPAFRVYSNGDLTVGTTTDRSVNTNDQVGMRYNARSGILQIGSTDRLDSTLPTIAYGIWPTSGLIINTDDPNIIKGRLMNTVLAANNTNLDSGWRTENSFIGTEQNHFIGGPDNSLIRSFIGGFDNTFSASVDGSSITGGAMNIQKLVSYSNLSGYAHTPQDLVNVSLVSGTNNQFGGLAQFVSGIDLINRTRGGATLGTGNVDFSSLPYTGWGDVAVPNQYKYPLLALGNAYGEQTIRTNALTVLYSGRTQINTTGYSNQLSETDVTPKAALDVVSTNTGVLLPRLTNAQRGAITSADLQNGLLLYNTDSSLFQYYNGSAWNSVGSGSGGGSRWLFSTGTNGTVYNTLDNIAIGTNDAKGYKLAVNGAAIFNTVKVKPTGSWPDYVFRKGYILPGLTEVEKYIRKYNHLPGVVSAKEAAQNGINVGENQAALLKKVEELTLYLIGENKARTEQEQQIKEQNARLERQQAEIDELKALIKAHNNTNSKP